MKLKYEKSINNGIVTVILNASNFSVRELKAIASVGEPNVVFKKKYILSNTLVDFNIPIRSFVGIKVVFKGKVDTVFDIAQEAYSFVCDIKEVMAEIMGETVGEFERLNALNKEFESIDSDILPSEEYPSDKPSEDNPDNPGNNDNDNPNPGPDSDKKDCGCSSDCNCGGIEIFEKAPDDLDELQDGKLFGIVLPDDEEDY